MLHGVVRRAISRIHLLIILLAAGSAHAQDALPRNMDLADTRARAIYPRVASVISWEDFQRQRPDHQRLLVHAMNQAARGGAPYQACFTPGTDPKLVEALDRIMQGSNKYNTTFRWSGTASSPGPLAQGDPTILTYSFVPDGTIITDGFEPAGPSNLFAVMNGLHGSAAAWQSIFHTVFQEWGDMTGVTYVYEPNDPGTVMDSWDIPGQPGAVADIRIGGHNIDGASSVLAYNYFPDQGNMVLDTSDTFFLDDATNGYRYLRNLIAHEHGHGQGIRHVCPTDETKLMEPFISDQYDTIQHDDAWAGQRLYGDRYEHNDTRATATDMGIIGPLLFQTQMISIDDTDDVDFFRFTTSAPLIANINVNPNGYVYLSGPQNSNGSCSGGTAVNSAVIHNLRIELQNGVGSTIAQSNSLPAGNAEGVTNVALAAGTYYIRISGSVNEDAQLYDLTVHLRTASDPEPTLTPTVTPSPTPITNDTCSTATRIGPGTISGSTGGTNPDGTSSCGTSSLSPDVWFSYTPAQSGTATVSTCAGATYDTVLSAHTSCNGSPSSQITCNDDFCGLRSEISFSVTPGLTYYIRVTGYDRAAGNFTLTLSGPPAVNAAGDWRAYE